MTSKKKRIIHSLEFKAETLKLVEKVGVAAAARQLSLHESQIYGWRKAAKKDTTTSQREQELATEVAKLKRQLVEQAEELDIVKKCMVCSVFASKSSLSEYVCVNVSGLFVNHLVFWP